MNEQRVTLINIYGPNSDSPEFYEKIEEVINDFDNLYVIVCGDFNIALNYHLDTCNSLNINNPNARKKLLEIINNMDLIDYYRILNPNKKIYTWHKKNPPKHARLDYFLTSENLSNIIENIYVKTGYRSDHSHVVLDLKFDDFIRGPGIWKFNNLLLNDMEYIQKVKNTITKTKIQYANILYRTEVISDIPNDVIDFTINDSLFFETLLMELRGITISHASFRKKEKNLIEEGLLREIEEIESTFGRDSFDYT